MGHSIATVRIPAEVADNLNDPYLSHTERILHAGERQWRDLEASRWDDASIGDGHLAPIMSDAAAHRWIEQNYEIVRRDSAVIPLAAADDITSRTQKMTLEVDGDMLRRLRGETYDSGFELREMVARHVNLPVVTVEVVKLPAARKPKAKRTAGTAVTVYEVVPAGMMDARMPLAVKRTLQEAMDEAARLIEQDSRLKPSNLCVRGRVIREGADHNGALATIVRPEPATGKVTVNYTTHTVKPGARPHGYLVAFDYHH